ncbi:MAG TPA: hypothetical protein VFP61_15935 [Acidimicrobiales bacterium]|nr:hypothetical protein [Acidimicrobiales bacterium]
MRRCRPAWIARSTAARSPPFAAATTSRHRRRNTPTPSVFAAASNCPSAAGSAFTASATTAACCSEISPARNAASVAGASRRSAAACNVPFASRSLHPDVRANHPSGLRSPPDRHAPPCAARPAITTLTAANRFSTPITASTTAAASSHDTTAGSTPRTDSSSNTRTRRSTSITHETLREGCDRQWPGRPAPAPRSLPHGRRRGAWRSPDV